MLINPRRFAHAALAAALMAAGPAVGSSASPAGLVPQVVDGQPLSITDAPWAVYLVQHHVWGYDSCSGSILDASHVVTAAHCVVDSQTGELSDDPIDVLAGHDDFSTAAPGDFVSVSGYRVHPGYEPGVPALDDVAVLQLSSPLDLSSASMRAVQLPQPFQDPTGSAVLAGFGRETPSGTPDGTLNGAQMTILAAPDCDRSVNAIVLCATSLDGVPCRGDSGAGVVQDWAHPVLLGVHSAGSPGDCGPGDHKFFVDVTAPEILDFIQGASAPPLAPRHPSPDGRIRWTVGLHVGDQVTCDAGTWTNDPTFTYIFTDAANGATLQTGASSVYVPVGADVGRTIDCRVEARTAGGVGVLMLGPTPAVAAAPTSGASTTPVPAPPAQPPAAPFQPVAPAPSMSVASVIAHAGHRVVLTVTLSGLGGFSGDVKICAAASRRLSGRSCTTGHATGTPSLTVRLRLVISRHARRGRHAIPLTAKVGGTTLHAVASVTVAGRRR